MIFIQEHNLRDRDLLSADLLNLCDIFINLAINQKGGTAILINKKLNYETLNWEYSADSRIISLRIKYYNNVLHLVNVYAPASATYSERDEFFQNELIYYLRNNLENVILGGDWNCVLRETDCTSDNIHISKGLLNVIRSIRCRDAWFIKNKNRTIEYTFIQNNYGSRIDRVYLKNIANYAESIRVANIDFSDHSGIEMTIKLPNTPKIGKFYWKLNVALLDNDDIKNEFKTEWIRIKSNINNYDTINDWWELCAKIQIRNFFIEKGKEESQKRYGLLQYLEHKLNRLYEKLNRTNRINYNDVKDLKDRISAIKTEILEGVKIRSRILEQIEGEKVSAYLVGRQNTIKSKKYITNIKVEGNVAENLNEGIILNKQDSIEWYVNKYFEKVYKKEDTDSRYQEWLLQFLDKKILMKKRKC